MKIKRLAPLMAAAWLCAGCVGNGASQSAVSRAAPVTTDSDSAKIELYRNKLAKDPSLYPVWVELGSSLLNRFREKGDIRDLDEAETNLVRSLGIQESEEGRRWLAAVRLDQHRFKEAYAEASRAIWIWPEDGIARMIQTDALIAQGKYEEAERLFQEVPAEKRDFYTIVGLSRLRFTMGDVPGTFALLEEAKSKLPAADFGPYARARAWCSLMMGSYWFELGKKDAALKEYEESLRLRPDWIEALEHRAEWEAVYGDWKQALLRYDKILANNTRPQELAASGKLLLSKGQTAEGNERIRAAEKMLRKRLVHGDVSVHRELILILVDHTGAYEEALKLAERDLEIRQDVLAYDSLAWAAFRSGDIDRAAEAMRQATKYGTPLRVLAEHRRAIENALSRKDAVSFLP
ncbi:MAG: tetratricopeptide repeat protein [Gammaproteobacteria bacterium]